jgi:hypothetical protein
MEETDLEQLKYPIGKFTVPQPISSENLTEWIKIIENFPQQLTKLVSKFDDEQLNTPYRPDGWTVRQVIHHIADSHMNSYIRFKWALTENKPTIKPYFEDRWAELHDGKNGPILVSLYLITSLHARWVLMLKGLTPNELQHTFIHPDGGREITLAENIGIYAWHCVHHFAHINNLRKQMNW